MRTTRFEESSNTHRSGSGRALGRHDSASRRLSERTSSRSSRTSDRAERSSRADRTRADRGFDRDNRARVRTYERCESDRRSGDRRASSRGRHTSDEHSERRTRVLPDRGRSRFSDGRGNYDYDQPSDARRQRRARSEEREYGNHVNTSRARHSRESDWGYDSGPDVYVRSDSRGNVFGSRFGSFGGFQGGHAAGGLSLPPVVAYAIPVIILILIILLVVFIVSSIQSCSAGNQEQEAVVEEVQPMNISFTPSIASLDAIADPATSISGFTLAAEGQSYMPSLSEEGQASINAALTPFTENEYDLGFLIMDLQTGSGYGYNLDTEMYGASSIKGPVLIYGCQEALEPGILSMSTVNDAASNAIIYSDNRSYYNMRSLFEEYSETSLVDWFASMNIESDIETDTSFPHYTARESAKLWMNAYLYFTSADSDPDIVSWAQNLFSQTEVSMLRSGVDPSFALVTDGGEVYYNGGAQAATDQSADQGQSGDASTDQNAENQADANQDSSADQSTSGDQATATDQASSGDQAATDQTSSNIVVYDKAGWLNGESDDGLCDAGIVIEGDKAYLISVMTGAPDSNENREAIMNLVGALWAQRASLAPAEGYVLVDAATSSENASGDTSGDSSSDASSENSPA